MTCYLNEANRGEDPRTVSSGAIVAHMDRRFPYLAPRAWDKEKRTRRLLLGTKLRFLQIQQVINFGQASCDGLTLHRLNWSLHTPESQIMGSPKTESYIITMTPISRGPLEDACSYPERAIKPHFSPICSDLAITKRRWTSSMSRQTTTMGQSSPTYLERPKKGH